MQQVKSKRENPAFFSALSAVSVVHSSRIVFFLGLQSDLIHTKVRRDFFLLTPMKGFVPLAQRSGGEFDKKKQTQCPSLIRSIRQIRVPKVIDAAEAERSFSVSRLTLS
jgi:hypothetical protein